MKMFGATRTGHARVVGCANLYAALDGGSCDGELSNDRLSQVGKYHAGRKGYLFIRDELWDMLDKQASDRLTLEELYDGMIDLSSLECEKFDRFS